MFESINVVYRRAKRAEKFDTPSQLIQKMKGRTFQLCTFSLKKRYGHLKNAHLPKKMPPPLPLRHSHLTLPW